MQVTSESLNNSAGKRHTNILGLECTHKIIAILLYSNKLDIMGLVNGSSFIYLVTSQLVLRCPMCLVPSSGFKKRDTLRIHVALKFVSSQKVFSIYF